MIFIQEQVFEEDKDKKDRGLAQMTKQAHALFKFINNIQFILPLTEDSVAKDGKFLFITLLIHKSNL